MYLLCFIALYMESEWTIEDFLGEASKRLDLFPTAKRIFNADGVEIDDCMMIVDNDMLFLSDGAGFQPPSRANMKGQSDIDGNNFENSESDNAREGENIGGFRVGRVLGRGAFGEVRMGEHRLTGEKVALKFLRKAEILTIGAAERTATEMQCLGALKHNNIIQLLTQLESPLNVVIVFELMEGGDLYGYLCNRGSTPQQMALPEDEARPLCHQILSAVSYAHNQHICHRDLKLENILLKGVNSLACVKIADFGLSDFYRPGVNKKSYCGTLSFLAPEVFKGTSNAGPPLDIWSMGVILFAVLCGRLPFDATTVGHSDKPRETIIRNKIVACQYKIDEKLGPEAKDLVRRMLKVDPGERASVPEIFNHVWLRPMSNNIIDFSPTFNGGLSTPNPQLSRNVPSSNVSQPIPIPTSSSTPMPMPIPPAGARDSFVDSLSQAEEQHSYKGRTSSMSMDGEVDKKFAADRLQDSLDIHVGPPSRNPTPLGGKFVSGVKESSPPPRDDVDVLDEFAHATDISRQSPNNSFMSETFESGVRSRVASAAPIGTSTPPMLGSASSLPTPDPSVIFPSFKLMPLRRNADTSGGNDSDDDIYSVTPNSAVGSCVTSPDKPVQGRASLGLGLGMASSPPADDKFRRSSTGLERKSSQSANSTGTHTPADGRCITPNSLRGNGNPSARHSSSSSSSVGASSLQDKPHRNSYGGSSRSFAPKQKVAVQTEPTTPVMSNSSKRYDPTAFSPANSSGRHHRDSDPGGSLTPKRR